MTSAKTSKPESSATKPANQKVFDKLYWTRIGLGAVGGIAAYKVFGLDYLNGLLLGLIFYLGSYYLARYLWFRELDRQDVGKIYSTGVGGYIMVFLFTWILLFTVASA